MEAIKYNQEQLTDKFGDGVRFGDAISTLESELWQQGNIICEVYIDDKFVSESEEKGFHGRKLDEIANLKIVTRKQDELIQVTIDSILKSTPEIKQKSKAYAEMLRDHGIQNNIDGFIEVMEGCQWFSESLFLLRPLVFKQNEDEEFQKNWNKTEEFFALVAQEALNSFEKKDFNLLSDILEYDLSSSLDKWTELLSSSAEVIGTRSS